LILTLEGRHIYIHILEKMILRRNVLALYTPYSYIIVFFLMFFSFLSTSRVENSRVISMSFHWLNSAADEIYVRVEPSGMLGTVLHSFAECAVAQS
jgi:hypothetical protein